MGALPKAWGWVMRIQGGRRSRVVSNLVFSSWWPGAHVPLDEESVDSESESEDSD